MPRNKDLKRLVRTRMTKTGESYAAARAQLTRKAPTVDYGKLAGMSNEAVKAKTDRDWKQWVDVLDGHDAAKLPHRAITRLLSTTYGTPSWWTQMIAVGYERIKGLRSHGQRRDGNYEATKSRTFDVDVETLFDAWHDAKKRAKWLGVKGVRIRTATRAKSIRFDWPEGGILAVGFVAKGARKSAVALAVPGVASREEVTKIKDFWAEKLSDLAELFDT